MTTKDTSRIEAVIKDRELLESRRRTIVVAATNLFIKRGYSNVSVNEVASEAGFSIGSLYKYIRTKEDILWLVIDDIDDQHSGAIERAIANITDPIAELDAAFRAYTKSIHANRRKGILIYREFGHLPEEAQREFIEREEKRLRVFIDIINEGLENAIFQCLDSRMIAINLLMASNTWVLKSYFFSGMPIDEYIDRQLSLTFQTLGVQAAEHPDS
jgi:TetR/AcrR family transcriptional regulator, cholesterol catabolism regulator